MRFALRSKTSILTSILFLLCLLMAVIGGCLQLLGGWESRGTSQATPLSYCLVLCFLGGLSLWLLRREFLQPTLLWLGVRSIALKYPFRPVRRIPLSHLQQMHVTLGRYGGGSVYISLDSGYRPFIIPSSSRGFGTIMETILRRAPQLGIDPNLLVLARQPKIWPRPDSRLLKYAARRNADT
ncbi:MAG: hypothetical protein KDK37_04245 [Leptospiraceae bacterium]|nr:hypothetical protein [Leptospiraceae bacterium]